MGKYSGKIGFAINTEISPDIFKDVIVERPYVGDVLENVRRFDQGNTLSGNVQITNQLSIVGDTFLFKNLSNIRYVTYKGNNWTVNVRESYPRIIVNLGGLYNGKTNEAEEDD